MMLKSSEAFRTLVTEQELQLKDIVSETFESKTLTTYSATKNE